MDYLVFAVSLFCPSFVCSASPVAACFLPVVLVVAMAIVSILSVVGMVGLHTRRYDVSALGVRALSLL